MGSDPDDINSNPPANSEVWVNKNAGVNGDGSQGSPFDNLSSAETSIATGGRLYVVGWVIDTPYTFTKEMSLR